MRMADGPVASLPQGFDAYAGYVNDSGIGETWREVVAAFPNAYHLSISTNGAAAMCADVEDYAMSSWSGFDYGYCNISQAQALINRDGRPKKLWIAHYNPVFGAHICSPSCGFGFTGYADGTQWTDHSGVWDESLLLDNFFDLHAAPPPKPTPKGKPVYVAHAPNAGQFQVFDSGMPVHIPEVTDGSALTGTNSVLNLPYVPVSDAYIAALQTAWNSRA